jgi:hypothetical protein
MITVKFCQVSFYTWSNYVAKDIYKDVWTFFFHICLIAKIWLNQLCGWLPTLAASQNWRKNTAKWLVKGHQLPEMAIWHKHAFHVFWTR